MEFGREYNFHLQSEPSRFDGQDIHKVLISVDDVIVKVEYNYGAIDFQNLKVYAGDPVNIATVATMKELDYGPFECSDKQKGSIQQTK